MFFEQKSLYTKIKGQFTYDASAPFFGAAVCRTGGDVTVISYGAAFHLALDAAQALRGEDIDCDVIDLRVLSPLDWETIARSIKKTGRCVVVHEDYPDYGVGAELLARVATELFTDLDAPPARVGAHFWPIPFSPPLEKATLPTVVRVLAAIRSVAAF